MAQVVEHLLCKPEALSSNPTKKKKNHFVLRTWLSGTVFPWHMEGPEFISTTTKHKTTKYKSRVKQKGAVTPTVILASWEVENRRMEARCSPGKKFWSFHLNQ
jgi:hypothetical protein